LLQPPGILLSFATGAVFDVAFDVRVGSPTFGQSYGTILDSDTMNMMYVPPGFAHGFVVLTERADFLYKCTNYYHPESEQGILWNDPELGIQWPISDVQLSAKDLNNPTLKNQLAENLPVYKKGA
jgi:dTDP-4-dehydrorhamnose 3,5-epimerase